MELSIRTAGSLPPGARESEVVERKGIGHPDTICDGIAEEISVRLCRAYLDRFGMILHHNVDKVLLCAGAARPAFGGGEVTEPVEIYLAGRATGEYGGVRIPVHDIAVEACRHWLCKHLRGLDIDRHVRVVSRLRPGSGGLTSLFARAAGGTAPLANDTSCGAGFARLTDLERVVLGVERALNSPDLKASHPEVGEDIKVMGVRHGRLIRLTISCAFVGRHLSGMDQYAERKNEIRGLAAAAAGSLTPLDVEVDLNAADDPKRGDVFLTVTGTSAEAGDDGEVGRGNRASGLITPCRAMTLEATAGKNPVNHVGKIYNLLAVRIASAVTAELPAIGDAACLLVSQIGRPIDDPQIVDLELMSREAACSPGLEAPVRDIVRAQFARMDALRDELLSERIRLY